MVTDVFAPLVKMHAKIVEKPHLRFVFVPHPMSRMPSERCRALIEGNDPVTGRPIVEEILEAFVKPLSVEERATGLEERTEERFIGPAMEEDIRRFFVENKMTDYLPFVLPTEERVAEMLKGTSRKAHEVVGELRAGYEVGTFTVEKVAANAVMAGARPSYLPVILALAASGIPAITTSTQSFARMIVVNGPVRKEIEMNSKTGALSPFNEANATIGRAATLLAINLGGGGIPGLTYWGSQGNNLNYNHVTFAEEEESLPPEWEPFHVQKGFGRQESVVSIFHGYGIWHWKNTFEREKHKAMLRMANWILPSGVYKSGLALLLDPLCAYDLVREGFRTKEALSEFICKNATLTLEEFWQYHLVEGFTVPAAEKGVEPFRSWLELPRDAVIQRYRDANEISVLVVGGRTNDFWQAGDFRYMGSFSVDEWR